MVHFIGLIGGLIIIFYALLVVKLYWQTGWRVLDKESRKLPEVWFAHGVVIAFLMAAVNAFVWKVGFRILNYGRETEFEYVQYGLLFDGLVLALALTWAAFCHLFAAYLNLTKSEQRDWNWVTIAFYPNHNLAIRTIHRLYVALWRRKT
jgi:hypothetical protein